LAYSDWLGSGYKRISIAYTLSASGGASGTVPLFQVPSGKAVRVVGVCIAFPAGTYGELSLSLYRGSAKIAPYTGSYQGDNMVIEDSFISDTFSSGDVVLSYANSNSTQTRQAYILVKAVMRE
jgi:hypothetical protein